MTEQPDTTAIRADYGINAANRDQLGSPSDDLAALCDALDDARGERGEWNAMLNEANERYEAAEARIREYEEKLTRSHDDREAAEARIAEMEDQRVGLIATYEEISDRCDVAEARIASALAVYHAGDWPTSGFPVSDRMAHALTEGTE